MCSGVNIFQSFRECSIQSAAATSGLYLPPTSHPPPPLISRMLTITSSPIFALGAVPVVERGCLCLSKRGVHFFRLPTRWRWDYSQRTFFIYLFVYLLKHGQTNPLAEAAETHSSHQSNPHSVPSKTARWRVSQIHITINIEMKEAQGTRIYCYNSNSSNSSSDSSSSSSNSGSNSGGSSSGGGVVVVNR